MLEIEGFWFPYRRYKAEKVVLQAEWIEHAFPHVKNWKLAIDVGAYVGTITRTLSDRFERVIAFEPLPDAFECLLKNVPNVECHNVACGNVSGAASYARKNAAGYAHFSGKVLSEAREIFHAKMVRLDDLDLKPDFIKIDAEFTDEEVLRGTERTISKYRPVLMVEIKGRAVMMDMILGGMGYRPVESSKVDAIYVPY